MITITLSYYTLNQDNLYIGNFHKYIRRLNDVNFNHFQTKTQEHTVCQTCLNVNSCRPDTQ